MVKVYMDISGLKNVLQRSAFLELGEDAPRRTYATPRNVFLVPRHGRRSLTLCVICVPHRSDTMTRICCQRTRLRYFKDGPDPGWRSSCCERRSNTETGGPVLPDG